MTVSKLSKGSILTPNHYNGRAYKITRVTIHEMAAVWTAERCGEWFRDGTRNASSNYGIGNDGKVMCYVEEQNAAWTSANYDNDNRAITIEVSNSIMGGDWPISDAAYNSLIALCADICNRYGIIPTYNGTPNASFTEHKMFYATACPGPYIHNLLASGKLIKDVLAKMKAGEKKPEKVSATVQLYEANGTDAQKWHPDWNADGTVSLKSKSCGFYLDVAGANAKDGATVQAYKKNGTAAQKWKLVQLEGPYKPAGAAPFELVPAIAEGKRLDVKNGGKKNETPVQIWKANKTNAQRWVVLDDGTGWWQLVNVNSGKVLDVKGGGR